MRDMLELILRFIVELHRWSLSCCNKACQLLPNGRKTDVRPTMLYRLVEIIKSAVELRRNASRVKVENQVYIASMSRA